MAVYSFSGLDDSKETIGGTIAADSPRQAREVLRGRGYFVTDLQEAHTVSKRPLFSAGLFRGVSSTETIAIIRDLSTLLAVGIPLADAFDSLLEQCTPQSQPALLQIRDHIQEGNSFAEAATAHPRMFDALSIKMIEVGEKTGQLEEVLSQLADFKEKSLQWKDRILGALAYPAIVLLASIGVTIFLMSAIVPTLLDNLVSAGRPLPWPTFILKHLSDFLVDYGAIAVLGTVGLITIFVVGISSHSGRRLLHRFILRFPIFGEMVRKQAVARVALIVSVLMRSGIEFVPACRIAADSIKNVHLQDALIQASQDVERGKDIGSALQSTALFPPVVIQVFSVGQQTGQLEGMLERLSRDYERQVATLSDKLATLLEPALIVLLSVVVGFILFATVLPILEAGNALSP